MTARVLQQTRDSNEDERALQVLACSSVEIEMMERGVGEKRKESEMEWPLPAYSTLAWMSTAKRSK